MKTSHIGDQSIHSEFLAVCGFSLIGLLVSVRAHFEWASMSNMTFLL
jgi:hypothetical protein